MSQVRREQSQLRHEHEDEMRTRYDRQVRLWGGAAQQQLQAAVAGFVGFDGLSSEVAKNVVLAGLGAVKLVDAEVVQESDAQTNHLITEDDVNRAAATVCCPVDDDKVTRSAVCAPRLHELNPFVKIDAWAQPLAAATELDVNGCTVVMMCGVPLHVVEELVAAMEGPRIVIPTWQFGKLTLAMFLTDSGNDCTNSGNGDDNCDGISSGPSMISQLAKLTDDAEFLGIQCHSYQKALLAVHATSVHGTNHSLRRTLRFAMNEDGGSAACYSYVHVVQDFMQLRADLGFAETITDKDIEDLACCTLKLSSASAHTDATIVDNSIVGGFIAQQVISHVSNLGADVDASKQPSAYKWMVVDTSDAPECLVG